MDGLAGREQIMITVGASGVSGRGGARGWLPCCHGNNLQPWPWAGVRGQREVTAEAMITVQGGAAGGGGNRIKGAGRGFHLTAEMWWKMSSTDGVMGRFTTSCPLFRMLMKHVIYWE